MPQKVAQVLCWIFYLVRLDDSGIGDLVVESRSIQRIYMVHGCLNSFEKS